MARTIRDAALESRTARARLESSGQPYYRGLEPGLLHLGYRKPRSGAGRWLARHYIGDGQYKLHKPGLPDEFGDPDGKTILSYRQAQERARKILREQTAGVGTVADAIGAHFHALEAEGRSPFALKCMRYMVDAHILPRLGNVELANLTADHLRRLQAELARQPARVRTGEGEKQRYRRAGGKDRDEEIRARKATVNRVFKLLRAALNFAFKNGDVDSDHAWRRIKAFKGVDRARLRYLSVA